MAEKQQEQVEMAPDPDEDDLDDLDGTAIRYKVESTGNHVLTIC